MRDRILNLATRFAEIPHLDVVEAVVGGATRKYIYSGCATGDSSVETDEDKWYGLVKLAPKGGGFSMNRYQMKTMLNGSSDRAWVHISMDPSFWECGSAIKTSGELARNPALLRVYGSIAANTWNKWIADIWTVRTGEPLPVATDSEGGKASQKLLPKGVAREMTQLGTLDAYLTENRARDPLLPLPRTTTAQHTIQNQAIQSPDASNADTRRSVPTQLPSASPELSRSSDMRATRKRQRSEDQGTVYAHNDSRSTRITPDILPHRGHEPAVKQELLSAAIQQSSGDRSEPIALDSDVGETWDSFLYGTWQGNPNNDGELQEVITDYSHSTGSTMVVPDIATLRIAWRQRARGHRVDETSAWIHWERMCMRRQTATIAAVQTGSAARPARQPRVKIEKQEVDLTEDD
ncbi:hypothetical protein B0A48_15396 [Cryoendolithus antarcticus]|uniref:Uncharacterized protein n=1 Tax=Cryoendolithus antarcticus TaxID=1507870 RepID=A0A1V8SID6_9PEZI|nr:hypothetical protein B0A48_15396 [Cryoendolithus antarcticus]